jgi:hypothetical protein
MQAEQARSQAALKRWQEENAEFCANEAAAAAGEKFCYTEQIADLQELGLYDRAQFKETIWRDPTFREIGNYHLFARSQGMDVRPVEEILDTAADRVTEEMPHVRHRLRSGEASRKRGAAE